MPDVSAQLVQECKKYVEEGNLVALQELCLDVMNTQYPSYAAPDWPYIFHRVYLHACLKGKKDIADWMSAQVYPLMDGIQQVALRQIFPYGRLLLARHAKYQAARVEVNEHSRRTTP